MSTPPVPPPYPNDPPSGGQFGQAPYQAQAPQYGQSPSPFPQAPQYGQAPQSGQPQQFGQPQQYGPPQPLVYPSELPQPRKGGPAVVPPPLVNIAFWLLIGACILWVGSVFLSIGSIDDPAMRRQFNARLAASGADVDFEALRGLVVGMVVLIAAVGVLMYAMVAVNMRKGRNWARILGTIFAAFSLLGVLEMGLGTLSILAGVASMVLLYLPTSAPYFRRYQPFAGPYGPPGYPYGR